MCPYILKLGTFLELLLFSLRRNLRAQNMSHVKFQSTVTDNSNLTDIKIKTITFK